jgi:hypothetical protein
MKNLIYRNQYIITNTSVNIFERWISLHSKDKTLNIYLHPDLPYAYSKNEEVEVFLLGYILDAVNPHYSNSDIVTILSSFKTFDGFLRATSRYGGRYLLILKNTNSTYLLPDALGSRQIYYYQSNKKVWCASQPNLIGNFIELRKRTDEKFSEFINSNTFMKVRDMAMIGDETIYEQVKHLMPNHYFNMSLGEPVRYWPNQPLEETPLNEAIEFSAERAKGLIKSARQRYELVIPFTAGWDSRLTVAATREIKDDLYYYIIKYTHLNENSPDIIIPMKLSKILGLNFNVLELEKSIDEKFMKIYNLSYQFPPQERYLKGHYSLHKKFQNKMVVSTGGSEIVRGFYYYNPKTIVNGKLLAALAGYPKTQYVIIQTDKWLNSSYSVSKEYDISIMDLFYWEQRVGNWAAQVTSLGDIYSETLSLFSCRELLTTMISVNHKYRQFDNKLYRGIMKRLWREILSQPINPPDSAKSYVKYYLKRINMYSWLKRFYYRKYRVHSRNVTFS